MGSVKIKEPTKLEIGSCLVKYQEVPALEADRWNSMIDMPGHADITIALERIYKIKEDGSPKLEVARRIEKETGALSLTFTEFTAKAKAVILGAGTNSTTAAAPATDEVEYKTFTGTAFESLKAHKNSTLTSFTVTTNETTPQECVEDTDYVLGEKEGSVAIRVKSGSTKLSDTVGAIVSYTWDVPARATFKFGGTGATTKYLIECVKELSETDQRKIYRFICYAAGKSEEKFADDFPAGSVVFGLVADTEASAGEQLYTEYEEAAVSA